MKDVEAKKRFLKYVRKTRGCWWWLGAIRNTYGAMKIDRKMIKTSRLSWMLFRGDIPDGMHVLHTCDERLCVNPNHLFLGTHQDNVADMVAKKRHQHGETHWKARLTESDVKRIRHLSNEGVRLTHLADKYDCTIQNIYRICKRTTWRHVD